MPKYSAHAKVNLLLSVGAAEPAGTPRAGWHRILSWFACIDLADGVSIERLADGHSSRHEVSWAADAMRAEVVDWPLEKDLAVRAHRSLEAHVGRALPASIKVEKRIPTGAGLGGGSSDAATVLAGLREVFALDLSMDELRGIGAALGSDVAFFLDEASSHGAAAPAVVSGFGESVERTGGVRGPVILVIPPFKCATAAVYGAFDALLADEQREDDRRRMLNDQKGPARQWVPREQLVRGRVERMLGSGVLESSLMFNDLAKAAFRVEPRLGQLSTAISRITRMDAHVTGSGSCLFLLPAAGKVEWVEERVRRVAGEAGAVVVRAGFA